MDKAKQAVSSFISGDGHHRTSVTEDTNQAVTDEQVRPHRHENITTAVDKEVHQDHHHTTVQPITAKETLPEKHHSNVVPVAHKTIDHGNERETRDTLDREAAKFQNSSVTHDTTHSSTTAPVVTGERVHHHVHEHIQPVINKETIQPHIVHTTIPIHETHHNKPIHHGTTVLPAQTLDEFNRTKGDLHGKSHKTHEYDGCPDKINKDFETSEHRGLGSHGHHHDHHHGGKGTAAAGAAAAGGAAVASHKAHNNDTRDGHSHGLGHGHHNGGKAAAATGAGVAAAGATAAHKSHNSDNTTTRGVNDHHPNGAGNTASTGAAGAAATAAHNSHSTTGTNATRGVNDHDHHHGAGKTAAAGAVAAATQGHNTSHTGTHNSALGAGTGGVTGEGYDNQRAADTGAASRSTNAAARDDIAHSHTTGNNGYTTSADPTTKSGVGASSATHDSKPRNGNGSSAAGVGYTGNSSDTNVDATGKKVSLVDKLNPFKDADGDGHRGIMS